MGDSSLAIAATTSELKDDDHDRGEN